MSAAGEPKRRGLPRWLTGWAPGERHWPANRLAVHFGHYQCLPGMFQQVLGAVAHAFRVPFLTGRHVGADSLRPGLIVVHDGPRFPAPRLHFRATHLIRDPRDLVVAAYLEHVRNHSADDEAQGDAGGIAPDPGYRAHLRALGLEEGLCYEMTHASAGVIEAMRRWNYADPSILELRLEEIAGALGPTFERIFGWYGLEGRAWRKALRIASRWVAVAGDNPGANASIGLWRRYFTPDLKVIFKRHHQDALEALGYERDAGW